MSLLKLTEEQQAIIDAVREFVEREVIPVADEMEHEDEYPEKIVEQMKEMGLFGMMVPEEYGGLGLPLTTYALVIVELARGWMSLSGILNTHSMATWFIKTFGTDDQKQRFLPPMATGNPRAALLMSEPHAGSDVQAIKTKAVRDGDDYVINGQKMWVTNGLRAGICMTLTKTDPDADPPYKGMSMFIVEKEPAAERSGGVIVGKNIPKLGYKGVETVELASEMCMEVCTEAVRIHGGYGYSKEFTVERLFRDAPFFLIGEGTSEIQKRVIGRQLLDKYKVEG